MGLKTAGVGHFTIPTAPAAGTSVTSGTANTFTTSYVALSASAPSALFITGIHLEAAAAKAATYIVVQLATGGAGSETIVGQYLVPLSTASTVALGYRQIYPPILVANATRIAAKTADSVGSAATLVTLECIAQANVVDDGVAVATVSAVTGLTASNLDAAVSSRMATYIQPTGFLAATFPTGTVANTTNITAGTITTTTNLTNAATAGDLTATMKTSVTTAATAATPTAAAVTGAVGSVTGAVGSVTGAVGSVTAGVTLAASQHVIVDSGTVTTLTNLPSIPAAWLTATGIAAGALNGKGDWNIGKTGYALTTSDWSKAGDAMTLTVAYDAAKTALASSSYTAPDNASVTAIKAKTDSLGFTVAGKVDAHLQYVDGVAIIGTGTALDPWRSA